MRTQFTAFDNRERVSTLPFPNASEPLASADRQATDAVMMPLAADAATVSPALLRQDDLTLRAAVPLAQGSVRAEHERKQARFGAGTKTRRLVRAFVYFLSGCFCLFFSLTEKVNGDHTAISCCTHLLLVDSAAFFLGWGAYQISKAVSGKEAWS